MATTRQILPTLGNPWISSLWILTALTGIIGFGMTTSNVDPTDPGYNPTAAVIGPPLIVVAGTLLTGLLVAGAITWQLRHR